METYGVKETREMLQFFVGLANVIDKTTQDGFQLTDLFDYIAPLSKLSGAIAGAEEIPLELYDLTDEEEALLNQDIEELDFASEYSELIAQQGLRAVKELAKLLVVINMARGFESVEDILEFLKKFFK
jgi:predicted SpoU family rRNA methylase